MIEVVRLILESSAVVGSGSTIGHKLLNCVEEISNKKEITEEDDILITKIGHLRKAELSGNIGWLDYQSWNVLNQHVKDDFVEVVDPLFFSGVYFIWSMLNDSLVSVFKKLSDNEVVYILKEGNSGYRLMVFDNTPRFDSMKEYEFKELSRKMESSFIRSFTGRSFR